MAKQPDWADDVVTKAIDGYQWNGRKRKSPICLREIAAKILRAERARAVRVVEKAFPDTWLHPYLTGSNALLPHNSPITPKHVENLLKQVKADILAKLKEGK